MTFLGTDIQPGWSVCASDGEELGTVASVEGSTIRIKKGGLLGGALEAPVSAVSEIETGRVELSMTKQQLQSTR
jgi:hypothetical protein